MKKIIYVFCICVLMYSCDNMQQNAKDDTGKQNNWGFNVVQINGCQYILYVNPRSCAMVHAGNCNNPIHKQTLQP